MRVIVVVALMVILLEVLLAAAFWAGKVWVGGWLGGTILLVAAVLLLVLPWIGDLQADYDTQTGQARLRLSWWGRVTFQPAPTKEMRIQILFIPWRKKLDPRQPKPVRPSDTERQQTLARRLVSGAMGNFEDTGRALIAVVQAVHELVWESGDFGVSVQSPTETQPADQAIAGLVGTRALGPIELSCTADGQRRVQAHYRIGLLRAALTLLYMVLQGRLRRLTSLRQALATSPQHQPRSTTHKEA